MHKVKEKPKLSKKQKVFVDEYLATGNGRQSALKAYNTTDPNVAGAIASENLTKPNVSEYITSVLSHRDLKPELIIDSLMQELKHPDVAARLKAAELLGKHLKLFTDRVDHTLVLEQVKKIGWADSE